MTRSSATPEGVADSRLRDLLIEISDLKRIRSSGQRGSIAERAFAAAWSALVSGEDLATVMQVSVATGICASRLGDLDRSKLIELGLSEAQAGVTLLRSFDAVSDAIDASQASWLRDNVDKTLASGSMPPFVDALAAQPRAGATCPGKARIMLEPPENHAEHCWAVAIFAVLLAPKYGADPAMVFLAGLSHHLHNALMPDSGFTGEMLLEELLDPVVAAASRAALEQLPLSLRSMVEDARRILPDVETAEGRAFHAADVIDRVTQLAQHLRVADVTLPMLLDEWQLVHEGPVKGFHDQVLVEMGLA